MYIQTILNYSYVNGFPVLDLDTDKDITLYETFNSALKAHQKKVTELEKEYGTTSEVICYGTMNIDSVNYPNHEGYVIVKTEEKDINN